MSGIIYNDDALTALQRLSSESVQCCVTSPPYWGLRDYGMDGQVGHEKTPGEYVARLVGIFGEVRRVLRDDGTCWINLGDSYAGSGSGEHGATGMMADRSVAKQRCRATRPGNPDKNGGVSNRNGLGRVRGLKAKDLVGIPWAVAFALRDAGWWLRSDIIWHKPNPMPESVTDRPTKAHEYVFLLAKSETYFYDVAAIAEPCSWGGGQRVVNVDTPKNRLLGLKPTREYGHELDGGRNARTVWTITTQPFPEAHFATFPEELAQKCILAGSRVGDTVLDPFAGSGTTCAVADAHQRAFIGIELNPEYADMARRRVFRDGAPLFSGPAK